MQRLSPIDSIGQARSGLVAPLFLPNATSAKDSNNGYVEIETLVMAKPLGRVCWYHKGVIVAELRPNPSQPDCHIPLKNLKRTQALKLASDKGKPHKLVLRITDYTQNDSGVYCCVVSNAAGACENQIDISFGTNTDIPRLVGPTSINRLGDNRYELRALVRAENLDSIRIQWSKRKRNDKPVNIDHSKCESVAESDTEKNLVFIRLRIVDFSYKDNGIYTCLVKNQNGSLHMEFEFSSIKDDALRNRVSHQISPSAYVTKNDEMFLSVWVSNEHGIPPSFVWVDPLGNTFDEQSTQGIAKVSRIQQRRCPNGSHEQYGTLCTLTICSWRNAINGTYYCMTEQGGDVLEFPIRVKKPEYL